LTESFASNDTSLEQKRPPTLTVQPIPNPGCMLVTRPAAYNPNDVETAPMQLRPPPNTKKWHLQPDLPEVSKPDLYMGYYDLKIHVQASTTPWLELMDTTKDVMNELWKWYPAVAVFVYEKKERISDGSYISCEANFKKIHYQNY
jgi:hypothetical protein